ncbi:MAG: hypothetical protein JWR12_3013 [Mucilaginibacter sp.]|nr:hypothetical protein [Mucilaginibacter sp.]
MLNAICRIVQVEQADDSTYIKLIMNFKALCVADDSVKDFAGKYKLFFGGRYQPSLYSIAYDIPLEIFENGIVKIDFNYINQIFWGLVLIRDINTWKLFPLTLSMKRLKA